MSDADKLAKKFQPENRYSNFGAVLNSIKIDGFRGINSLPIEFQYPITAISGLNGAGKSTVGQLCLGAYRKPSTVKDVKRFYVRDFFPASVADPNPFRLDSTVVYEYQTTDPAVPQTLTVARKVKEWSGYKRQPERACYYIGFTIYIPKVEQRDLSVYRGSVLKLGKQRPIPVEEKEKVGRILGQQYDGLHFQNVIHGIRAGELGIAARFGAQYSENNMGFGEGRTLYMVDLLENSPIQSLFVIEEPETSLHENAQHELAKYLLDVCNRRHHQIVLTTHSSTLLKALPPEARIMLARDKSGVSAFPRLSAARAQAILSNGHQRELSILVEDEFASRLLAEMIRRVDRGLFQCVDIFAMGDTGAVRSGALFMQKMGRPYIAIRDADIGPDSKNGIFSLPGHKPPEREVYDCPEVQQAILDQFGIDVAHTLIQKQISDHHKFCEALASEAHTPIECLRTTAIVNYLDTIGNAAFRPLIESIQAALPK